MPRPNKKTIEKMKKQDEELKKLPTVEQEKKMFKKDESKLKQWTKKIPAHFAKLKKQKKKVKKN